MKKVVGIFIVLVSVCFFTFSSNAKGIAFVNLRQVLQESQAGKAAKNKIQSLIEAKKIVIQKKSKALRDLLKKINAKGISKAEKDKLKKEYEKKFRALQEYQAQASEDVRKKEMEETNKILKMAINTIKVYAKKHDIDGVFEVSQGGVIYWKDSLNITKKIIKLMDNQYKTK